MSSTNYCVVGASAAILAAGATAYYYQHRPPTSRGQLTNKAMLQEYELYPIDYTMHQEHRKKLMERFARLDIPAQAAIVLDGGEELSKYDTDTIHAFRQESFMQYLFGVKEPGCRGVLDLQRQESVLFVPRLSAEWELWCGKRKTLQEFQAMYQVDAVYYIDETAQVLQDRRISFLYRIRGQNSDSGLTTVTTSEFPGIEKFTLNDTVLYPELVECRVIKTEKELKLMRFINALSSKAHIEVMRVIQPNLHEFHAESTFLHACYALGGARLHAYTCICGAGNNASALHYGHAGAPNEKRLVDGDIFLNDMGAELHGYASDITCTFPVNGKFTLAQQKIYEGVLKSHDAVIAAIKDGVEWFDMHVLSHRVLTQHLFDIGLFQNGTVDDFMEAELSAYFYPHGLGHLMGLDVHDVGGYPKGIERSTTRLLRKLRCGRKLHTNMVVTVEPGCYFIDALLDELLSTPQLASYINQDMLQTYRQSGGVRIESDIIVLATGAENMTNVPRTIAEIEACMQGSNY